MTGIKINHSAKFNNTGSVTGNYYGIEIYGKGGITNHGSINATDGFGIKFFDGGYVTNYASAYIGGISNSSDRVPCGVYITGGKGLVTNAGTIYGTLDGVYLKSGGTVNNELGGSIKGSALYGVLVDGGAGVVTNQAGIIGGRIGVGLNAGGTVRNKSGGVISGALAGVAIYNAAGTVTNAGTIDAGSNYLQESVFLDAGGSFANYATGNVNDRVEIFGNGVVTNAGKIDELRMVGATEQISNSGSIGSVVLDEGGTLHNLAGGSIGAAGAAYIGGPATVTNAGTIAGIYFHNEGKKTITNLAHGVIEAASGYAFAVGGVGFALANYGTISATAANAVAILVQGDTVTNHAGAKIEGGLHAIYGGAGTAIGATVTNAGSIIGGIDLKYGGKVVNQSGGKISGAIYIGGAVATITNAGSIISGAAGIQLAGSVSNTLTLQTGSSITGEVNCSGANGKLILVGQGNASNWFADFVNLTVDASGTWTLGHALSTKTTTVAAGALVVGGGLMTAMNEDATASVSVSKGATLTLNGKSSLAGDVSGLGALAVTAGLTIASGASISVAKWSILGASASATFGEALTYAGALIIGSRATVTLSGGALTLTGTAAFTGAIIAGSQALIDDAVSKVAGLTVGGAGGFVNEGQLMQTGAVTVGDSHGDVAALTNAESGIWDITNDSNIGRGSSAASSISNLGSFEKTGGAGVNYVAPAFANNGQVMVSSGTLDLTAAVTGTGTDTISGAATLEFGATVASGQTIDFTGAGGVLELFAPRGFSGAINGFDTIGSSDSVDLLGFWSISGFASTATQSMLTLSNGKTNATLAFDGSYSQSEFRAVHGSGHTTITYG